MRNLSPGYWLLLGAAALAIALVPIDAARSTQHATRNFRIEASQYAYNPGEIAVNPGDTVTIQLVSTDVVHGLYIDGYDLSLEADPGQTTTLTFVADKPGSFRFRCNVTCGAMHPFMIGKLNVGANEWLYRSLGLALLATIGSVTYFVFRSRQENTQYATRNT